MAALEEYNDADVSNRLRRIEGQIRGIIRMVDEGRHCEDVITQMLAARKEQSILRTVVERLQPQAEGGRFYGRSGRVLTHAGTFNFIG